LASMGIYAFDAEYLFDLLEHDQQSPQSTHDFGQDLLPKIVASGEALAHPFSLSCVQQDETAEPSWRDVGTLEAYCKVNLDLPSVMPELDMHDGNRPIHTHMDTLPPARFVQDRSGVQGTTMNSQR
ncbi:glucose-1-phosphate adenylyltransferase, partial [Erwinia amylovora]|uniref:sugar phosphate nucleotidyltransferase n=1 Tax=Erwinia amylovora TaxID=552 RepID=UPI0010062E3E